MEFENRQIETCLREMMISVWFLTFMHANGFFVSGSTDCTVRVYTIKGKIRFW